MHVGQLFRSAVLALASTLGACAHIPPAATAGCSLPAYRLVVSKDGLGVRARAADATDVDDFAAVINRDLSRSRALRAGGDDLLILSGGSQHGAFGAGFFAGMGAKVPEYGVVTGVSTGALVSTLVFLANDPVAPDRVYPAYMKGVRVSNLEDNASIFAVDDEGRIIHPWNGGVLEGVAKGSLATFAPLRSLIFGMLSETTLREIQAAHRKGRHLLVGVTNLETGDGSAIDLAQYVDEALTRDTNRDAVRTCYIDALIASSSVPPGMPPTRLTLYNARHPQLIEQPSLYIDGGARFGVFWGQLESKKLPRLKTATMLINGTLSAGPWDEFARKGKWSILSVAKRSSEILVNQIYRFSVNQIEQQPSSLQTLHEAYISNVGLAARYGAAAAVDPDQYRLKIGDDDWTCGTWRKFDDDHFHPLEFRAHYMQCLVAYGRQRGASAPWNQVRP